MGIDWGHIALMVPLFAVLIFDKGFCLLCDSQFSHHRIFVGLVIFQHVCLQRIFQIHGFINSYYTKFEF